MANVKEIWNTLSSIDVSEHIEKKGNLSYLSWPWAWAVMKDNYPQFFVVWEEWREKYNGGEARGLGSDVRIYEDGSYAVACSVHIDESSEYMWLPVMDYKNKAIIKPDSRAISDAKMRCMVKCFALHGLGHYIYAGEDLPAKQEVAKEEPQKTSPAQEAEQKPLALASPSEIQEAPKFGSVITTYEVFCDGCDNLKELHDFWAKNKEELKKLETSHPKVYTKILGIFSNKKSQITKEVANG